KNFREYIIDIRLEKAKEMIRNTELTIKEIGINIGYEDPNYFTKIFRKKIGITPSEYRNRLNYLK
ncbi:MAG: helix-turn-helix transcriptional regulator, partial [Cellulosilyticaceae bacterium]